jgi:2-polyprenyl-6-methoxyphenol hydroxylase-like FAD-dependent oxidoreductase
VPYSGQGAASGIEDAAVLSELFRHASPQDDLQRLARLYEGIRQPRVKLIQMLALVNGVAFSFPDGPKQQKRDQIMQRRPPNSPDAIPNPKARLGSLEFELWLDNWDAIQEVSLFLFTLPCTVAPRNQRKADLYV